MPVREDTQFIRRYDALPQEFRGAFRRAYADSQGIRIRIRDLEPMRRAADRPVRTTAPMALDKERANRRRIRSSRRPSAPRRGIRPGTHALRRTFARASTDGGLVVTITIVIKRG
ncbi:hypothetical protein OG259_26255 [Streptomyces sp. NBC_00250]|uniref:hypothetical protein n=1 Tax=Streptomyces sp. NBC_00250 TaxID=2903641 RepID=UPI002E28453A|nr:hypothetical protein [Streptomyces sp. NBC_00250]